MNSNDKTQYEEMKLFFDSIRNGVLKQPHQPVELRDILHQLNTFELKHKDELITYPMFTNKDSFLAKKKDNFYISKGSCFPPYMEFSVNNRLHMHRKLRTYEIIIPSKLSSCDTTVVSLAYFLLDKQIEAEVKASTNYGNANIRVFLETEEDAKTVRDYCFSQPLIYLNMRKPNPFLKRISKNVIDGEKEYKPSLGYHINPYGAGMESVEYLSVFILEYVEQARTHEAIEAITVDKFMKSLEKRQGLYKEEDPKKKFSQALCTLYHEAKEIDSLEKESKKQTLISTKKDTGAIFELYQEKELQTHHVIKTRIPDDSFQLDMNDAAYSESKSGLENANELIPDREYIKSAYIG